MYQIRELLHRSVQMDGSTVPRTKIKSNRAIPDLFRTRRFEQNRSRGLETLLTWSDPRFKIIIHQNSANFAHFRSTVFTSLFRHQGTILRLSCPKTVPVSQLQLTKTGVKARFLYKSKVTNKNSVQSLWVQQFVLRQICSRACPLHSCLQTNETRR